VPRGLGWVGKERKGREGKGREGKGKERKGKERNSGREEGSNRGHVQGGRLTESRKTVKPRAR